MATKIDLSHIAESLRPLAVLVSSLTCDPANARLHPARNLEGIKGSLAVYGQQKPLVVRRETMTVVCGNGTLEAARALGWTHVAASVVPMDAATAAGLAIADNRTSDLSEWNNQALDKMLSEVILGQNEHLDILLGELASECNLYQLHSGKPDNPDDVWQGLPEFHQDEIIRSALTCIVRFRSEKDRDEFEKFLGYKLIHNGTTYSTWFPKPDFN